MDERCSVRAIFVGEFHYSSRRRNAGWSAYPSPDPQKFPREFITAAINAGRALPIPKRRGGGVTGITAAVPVAKSGD
ncbi:MAG: hypothetical protein BGP11_12725 [Rhodobacterales bacterium 65-51]|uniref:hypothetical protein n=1 Tax=uncultured Gemmobacter sp. TaxID=1095917 RepID=UPI000965CA29|nr:hypothetical protein [uncultured Gemmobacter sp.]OJY33930.1 MAG: hypothetical protein BGP11_12725 [Rhodobacterales bacterium 65-51]